MKYRQKQLKLFNSKEVINFIMKNNSHSHYSITYQRWNGEPTITYTTHSSYNLEKYVLRTGDKIAFDENDDIRKYNFKRKEWE